MAIVFLEFINKDFILYFLVFDFRIITCLSFLYAPSRLILNVDASIIIIYTELIRY